MAADTEPLEILLHLPLLCEDKVSAANTIFRAVVFAFELCFTALIAERSVCLRTVQGRWVGRRTTKNKCTTHLLDVEHFRMMVCDKMYFNFACFQRWGEHVVCPDPSLLAPSPSMKGPSSSLKSHRCSRQLRNSSSKNRTFSVFIYMYLIVHIAPLSDSKSSYYNHILKKNKYMNCIDQM